MAKMYIYREIKLQETQQVNLKESFYEYRFKCFSLFPSSTENHHCLRLLKFRASPAIQNLMDHLDIYFIFDFMYEEVDLLWLEMYKCKND